MLGLGKARRSVPETWATAVLDTFTGRLLSQADPGDVCRLIGACGLVVVKPHGSKAWVQQHPAVQAQLQQCVAWLLPQLAGLEPPWLLLLVRGLVRLGCSLQHSQVCVAVCGVAAEGRTGATAARAHLCYPPAALARPAGARAVGGPGSHG
jgi:hypothetical protein